MEPAERPVADEPVVTSCAIPASRSGRLQSRRAVECGTPMASRVGLRTGCMALAIATVGTVEAAYEAARSSADTYFDEGVWCAPCALPARLGALRPTGRTAAATNRARVLTRSSQGGLPWIRQS